MDPITPEQIENWFGFHPATPSTGPLHDQVRRLFRDVAHRLSELLPPGADRTVAIRKTQEAMWAANAAIACNQPVEVLPR